MKNLFDMGVGESLLQIMGSQEKMVKGIETLMNVDYSGYNQTPKELVFQMDKMKLYHYKPRVENTTKTPLIVVYALVNKEYMMDIQPDKSMMRKLLEGGIDVYIIDWGYPTADDRYLTLGDYINGYIDEAVEFVRRDKKVDKVNLMGICQGGTFSFIYTATHQEKIKNLVSLVTPIDFDQDDGLLFKWGPHLNADKMVEAFGNVPGDFMNAGFVFLKPYDLMIDKYIGVIDTLDDEEKLANFLRMEQWIFDSPDQAGEAYREFQNEMYHKNSLIKGEFYLEGEKVDLKNVTCPVLAMLGTKDNQVPPSATRPIPEAIGSKDCELVEINTGHIGLFVSGRSQREVSPKIIEFLTKRDK
ncbi:MULTISPECIES: class III poly(R)-hydroxyalkanoic acid synthase subunit PhaC [Peptoniphilus]|uniref:Poly(3-hydroxyalkanoate) polymerase subunit PhaC n=1 Tax=Peptoniphilus duerdenii ATCC BAA-1640 TaxID=862517 RepID=E0NP47_9FIRM|nr:MULTISPECIES: class III poly(R)-hydroxyalkanoic acid synthase subunit PhaC [Peptoniphilus]EFM24515.1 poly(R)-hydroxyalkanoic acid synthase, class III, PhaC subunit [Peptoniphilus duerdenii ATCC BAA-1640]ERT63483.1 poly(R)-hydroxyalkanoic acid synthase, class III, PhaC subunit [Peptoniphilus sp. BV3AC2]MDK8275507.1 class III poly(R)-hydroxyalkanoic acid synthase subunit PhaC [Peptoniphilus duerdenii]